jgi:hypothetical protein
VRTVTRFERLGHELRCGAVVVGAAVLVVLASLGAGVLGRMVEGR